MYRAGKFVIEDQLSTNGTWVNGEDVGPRGVLPLKDSDLVKVGDTTFVFKCFSWPEE
jgi:pSer/pThr/pTyr-binding forkhead associated (FHA) protein